MEPQLFAMRGIAGWAEKVSAHLEIHLSKIEERDFADGENKTRPLESVRGRDVFVMESLFSDNRESVNDKILRLLFFINTLKDNSAASVTAVIPYLAYTRKDRRTKDRDPVALKYLAHLLESAGTDRLMTLEAHNLAAFQNAFRIPVEHFGASALLAPVVSGYVRGDDIVIVSPDAGAMKRAAEFCDTLSSHLQKTISHAYIEKTRNEEIITGTGELVGDVAGKTAIIVDDIIVSGMTMQHATDLLHNAGAKKIYACAAHGSFAENPSHFLTNNLVSKIFITDTMLSWKTGPADLKNVTVVDSTLLFARAIRRSQAGDSVTALMHPSLRQRKIV